MTECILFTLFSLHKLFKARDQLTELTLNPMQDDHALLEIEVSPEDIRELGSNSLFFESKCNLQTAECLRGKVKEVKADVFQDLRGLNFTTDSNMMQ